MAKSASKKPASPLTSRSLARLVAQSAFDVKAEEIIVLDLRTLSSFTDYFVIASGRSDRQVRAMADRIEENVKKRRPISVEGYAKGHWILIDYGEVVAHIFYEETRTFYSLEKLWGDAPRLRLKLK